MRLSERFWESEAVGFVLTMCTRASDFVRSVFEDPAERSSRKRILEVNKQDEQALTAVALSFLEKFPALDTSEFHILRTRFRPTAYVLAVYAVTQLLRDCQHLFPSCSSILLTQDGAMRVICLDTFGMVMGLTTQEEVSRALVHEYQFSPDEITWNLQKAHRLERELITGEGMVHAQMFLRWIQLALCHKPNLIPGFLASGIDPSTDSISLRVVPIPPSQDLLERWRVS